MAFRQIFGGCTAPKYLTEGVPSNIWGVYSPQILAEGVPSNIWGVYSPQIFDGWRSVIYLGGVQPPNISRKGFRQKCAGCTAPKYLTDGVPSNIWWVYSPQIFDGRGSVKYLGGVQPPNISRKGFRQKCAGCTAPKYLTDGVPSNIWWVYSPQIFDGRGSVKYLGGVQPPNFGGRGSVKYLGGVQSPNI